MIVVKDLKCEVPYTNTHYFGLDEYSKNSNRVLFYGYHHLESNALFDKFKGKERFYLNVTAPTEFCSPQPTEADDKFDRIYTICPYTVHWLNALKGDKYRFIWYPFNENDIPSNRAKLYDVCYHGGIHGQEYVNCLETLRKFNYRYMSMTHGINQLTRDYLRYATDINLSNSEKLKRISECKISVCFNSFTVRNQEDLNHIKSRPEWQENLAFSLAESDNIVPQVKSRLNEAAFCRTLNLVKRDAWNVVERFYEPDEFVYFDNLEETITEVLQNFDRYEDTIEKAYQRSLNYTTKKLYEKIKNDL